MVLTSASPVFTSAASVLVAAGDGSRLAASTLALNALTSPADSVLSRSGPKTLKPSSTAFITVSIFAITCCLALSTGAFFVVMVKFFSSAARWLEASAGSWRVAIDRLLLPA